MSAGFLIVRRAGALWGLPAEQVAGIERVERVERAERREGAEQAGEDSETGGLELRLAGGGSLAVDTVLTLAGELRVQPLSARLRRFLPAGSAGLALLAGEPLVLMAGKDEVSHV
jgi:hypothetical protein